MKEYTAGIGVKAIESDGVITILTEDKEEFIIAFERKIKDKLINQFRGWIERLECYLEAVESGMAEGYHSNYYCQANDLPSGEVMINLYADTDLSHSSLSGVYSSIEDCKKAIGRKIDKQYSARLLIDLIYGKGIDQYGRKYIEYKEVKL